MTSLVANNPYDVTQQKFTGFGDVSGQITGGARNGTNWDFMDQQGKVLTSIPYDDYVNNYQAENGSGAVRSGINSVNGVSVYNFGGQSASQPAASSSTGMINNAAVSQPADWSTYNAQQKIDYFNKNNITSDQLKAAGVSQADLDWMSKNGYTGGNPAAVGLVGGAINKGSAQNPTNPTTGVQNATAATYTPALGNVKANETVANQMDSLLAQDSPLMQRARTLAMQGMNQRGLVNSSMAQGAGTAAMIDRITPIAQQDAATYSNRALANMDATNQAGMFNAGEANRFSIQNAQQAFSAAQANLDRAQQTALADKSIAAQKDLQTAQQTFQAAQAALDRTQQTELQKAQQTFQSAQAELDRAQQTALADKSIKAQQDLQAAQQSFASAQAALDRSQQTSIANAQIQAQKDLQAAQQSFSATQASLDRDNQQNLLKLQDTINDANVSAAFAATTAQNTLNAINTVQADPNLTPEAKKAAIDNVIASGNSTIQWGSTFYNTTLPTISGPGGTAGTVSPGAGAGAGVTNTGTTSSGPKMPDNVASYSAEQKANVYNDLRDQGYTDAQIRQAAESKFGAQKNEDWAYFTNLAKTV